MNFMKPHTYRHYDSKIGRFITSDPIGFSGGDTNLYRYVRNQADIYKDPSGMTADDILKAWEIARKINPALPQNINFAVMGLGTNNGLTLSPFNTIILHKKYLGVLSNNEKLYLLTTIIHESMHFSDGFWNTIFNERHDEIYIEANRLAHLNWLNFINMTESNQCKLY